MPQPNRAEYRAMVAALCDRFGLTPQQVGGLTSRQQRELYAHPRDSEGNIEVPFREATAPERVSTLEEELMQLEALALFCRWPAEELAKLREQLRAKYHATSNASTRSGVNGDGAAG